MVNHEKIRELLREAGARGLDLKGSQTLHRINTHVGEVVPGGHRHPHFVFDQHPFPKDDDERASWAKALKETIRHRRRKGNEELKSAKALANLKWTSRRNTLRRVYLWNARCEYARASFLQLCAGSM